VCEEESSEYCTKTMFSPPRVLLLPTILALLSRVATAVDASTASRLDLLEQRIASLEELTKTQTATIEELSRRNLQSASAVASVFASASDGCLPKRNDDNVCVYDDDTKFFFQNADLVFNSSTVRFTGPIVEFNTLDSEGNVTNLTGYDFSSHVIFESTDILVENSNVSFTAEHNYTAFETNKTDIAQYYGYVNFNNTEVALNSSRFFVVGQDPREVNRSLYDNLTYANLFASVGFSFADISIEDSNTTFTTNSSSGTDDSTVSFNYTKISYKNTDAKMADSTLDVEDSSISYGKRTSVHWYGDSSKAYFTDGVDFKVEDSTVIFDDTNFELTGHDGRFVTRVDTYVRGPEGGDPIEFEMSRRVDVRFEQDFTLDIYSNVDFKQGCEVIVDKGADLVIDGKFESKNEAEFHGDIRMEDVELLIKGDLLIDGEDDYDNADIQFLKGVEVRFMHDVRMDRNLYVSENTVLDSLDVSDTATVGGRLHCRKGATISGDSSSSSSITSKNSPQLLKVEGSATVNNKLKAGTTSVTGGLTANTIKAESNLDVSGTATTRNLDVTGATKLYSLTATSNVIVSGATTLGSLKADSGSITGQLHSGTFVSNSGVTAAQLNVSGKTVTGSLGVTFDADVSGDLNVGGTTELDDTVFFNLSVLGKATVDSLSASSATITGATTTQTLTVNRDANIGGDLDVGGSTNLADTITNDVRVIGSADVGTLTANSASISGTATVKTLAVNANADVYGNLNVGTVTVDSLSASSADISGAATIQTLTVNSDAKVGGDMEVDGSTELASTIFVDISVLGEAKVGFLSASSADIDGPITVQRLSVDNDADFGGAMNVVGGMSLASTVFDDITVRGTATIESLSVSSVTISDRATVQRLTVEGNAKVKGDIDVRSLEVTANTTLLNLVVEGNATVNGTLDVEGVFAPTTSLFQDIDVSGKATVKSLKVKNNANVGGDLKIDGSTSLASTFFQDITVLGTATVGALEAQGAARVDTLDVNDVANVGGDLHVDGSTKLASTIFMDISILGEADFNVITADTATIGTLSADTATIDTLE